jgi:hypothetical protein
MWWWARWTFRPRTIVRWNGGRSGRAGHERPDPAVDDQRVEIGQLGRRGERTAVGAHTDPVEEPSSPPARLASGQCSTLAASDLSKAVQVVVHGPHQTSGVRARGL